MSRDYQDTPQLLGGDRSKSTWWTCWTGWRRSVPVSDSAIFLSLMRKTGNSIEDYKNFR